MLDMDIQELASLSAGDGDLENFGRLFSKLKEMKGTLCFGKRIFWIMVPSQDSGNFVLLGFGLF